MIHCKKHLLTFPTIFKRETKIKNIDLNSHSWNLPGGPVVQNRPFNAGMQVLNLVKTCGLETHAMGPTSPQATTREPTCLSELHVLQLRPGSQLESLSDSL